EGEEPIAALARSPFLCRRKFMGSKSVRLSLLVACVLCGMNALPAQTVAAASPPAAMMISARVASAPLKEVLDYIAREAGLTAVYSDLVSQSPVRVTMNLRHVSVVHAFDVALRNTG